MGRTGIRVSRIGAGSRWRCDWLILGNDQWLGHVFANGNHEKIHTDGQTSFSPHSNPCFVMFFVKEGDTLMTAAQRLLADPSLASSSSSLHWCVTMMQFDYFWHFQNMGKC